MQRRCEASGQSPRVESPGNCRVRAEFLAPLLALALVPLVSAAHAENRRLESTAALPGQVAYPAVVRDHRASPAVAPVRLPAAVAVPRRLPPIATTQAAAFAVKEIDVFDQPLAEEIDLQLPGETKARVGGWVGIGYTAGGLAQ